MNIIILENFHQFPPVVSTARRGVVHQSHAGQAADFIHGRTTPVPRTAGGSLCPRCSSSRLRRRRRMRGRRGRDPSAKASTEAGAHEGREVVCLREEMIPITPMEKPFSCLDADNNSRTFTRKQLPITETYAFTHCRSQGQTSVYVIIDLSSPRAPPVDS